MWMGQPEVATFEALVTEVSGERVLGMIRSIVIMLVVASTALAVGVSGVGTYVAAPCTLIALILGVLGQLERGTRTERVARLTGPVDDVVWLWSGISQTRFGRRPMLSLGYIDGTIDRVPLQTTPALKAALAERFPHALTGHSEARQIAFEESPDSFLDRATAPITDGSW